MSQNGINRRDFLKSSAVGAAAVSGAAGLTASQPALALQLDTLTEHEGKTLLGMTRQLYPHDLLGDQYYADVVAELDAEAGDNGDTQQLIKDGVAQLDNAMGIKWIDLSDGHRLGVLKSLQETPFFQKVKSKTLVSLYNNPLVWRHFGYEGESFSKGGYIHRGFNDLSWLPDPPDDASPPVA